MDSIGHCAQPCATPVCGCGRRGQPARRGASVPHHTAELCRHVAHLVQPQRAGLTGGASEWRGVPVTEPRRSAGAAGPQAVWVSAAPSQRSAGRCRARWGWRRMSGRTVGPSALRLLQSPSRALRAGSADSAADVAESRGPHSADVAWGARPAGRGRAAPGESVSPEDARSSARDARRSTRARRPSNL